MKKQITERAIKEMIAVVRKKYIQSDKNELMKKYWAGYFDALEYVLTGKQIEF